MAEVRKLEISIDAYVEKDGLVSFTELSSTGDTKFFNLDTPISNWNEVSELTPLEILEKAIEMINQKESHERR